MLKICEGPCGEPFETKRNSTWCVPCRTKTCWCGEQMVLRPSFIKKHKTFSCSFEHARIAQSSRLWSEENIRFLTEHRLTDMTIQDLADHFDVSMSCIVRKIKSLGLPPLPRDLKSKRTGDALRHSKDQTIKRLQALHASGSPINARALQQSTVSGIRGLYMTGVARFGSYRNFLRAAGFNPAKHDLHFSRKENVTLSNIIEGMRDARQEGKDLHFHSVQNNLEGLCWIGNAIQRRTDLKYKEVYGLAFPDENYDEFKRSHWGERTQGDDGQWYASATEAIVANTLHHLVEDGAILSYITQVKVQSRFADCTRRWTCDFLVSMTDQRELWVEVDGMGSSRPEGKYPNEKTRFYDNKDLSYIVIDRNHMHKVAHLIQGFWK